MTTIFYYVKFFSGIKALRRKIMELEITSYYCLSEEIPGALNRNNFV